MKQTVEYIYCDCCGKLINDLRNVGVSETNSRYIDKITFNVYYSKPKVISDICQNCSKKVLQLIDSLAGIS